MKILKFVKHVLTLALFVLALFQVNAQCWYVEDNGGSTPDELCVTDPPSCQDILYPDGTTPVRFIEALSIDPTGTPIYGADGGQVGILDIPTAVFTPYINTTGYSDIDGLAYDPFANILYATTRNSGLDSIFQVYTTGPNAGLPVPGTVVAVSGSGGNVDELAITPINCGTAGTIYASIDKGGGTWVLAKINPTTGVATEIGTGFGISDVESISFSGNCELYGNTGGGQLYLIDTTLGTVVGSALTNVPGGDVEGMACDFGPGPFAGSIGGTIFADNNANGNNEAEPGIGGVLLNLLDEFGNPVLDPAGNPITTTTAPNGSYIFDNLMGGDYIIQIDPSNILPGGPLDNDIQTYDEDSGTTSPNLEIPVILSVAEDHTTADFGFFRDASIGDTIVNDDTNAPIDGVIIYLLDDMGAIIDSASTANGGMYIFDSLFAMNYIVLVAPSNFVANGALENMINTTDPDGGLDDASMVTLLAGVDNLDQDYGYSGISSIGDTITNDDTNAPIDGVLVYLLDDMGAIIDSALTANGGMYLFDSLTAGDYVVGVAGSNFEAGGALDNMINTTDPDSGLDNTSAVTLAAGVDNLDQDFGYTEFGSISGTITDSNGVPLEGVELILFDANNAPVDTALTLADGTYEFSDVASGNYNVVETQPNGYTDVSEVDGGADADNLDNGIVNNIPVTVDAGEADAGNDFVELLTNSSIGDMITDDQSGTGIDGVLIVLYDDMGVAIDSAITANGGIYLFENLTAAVYTVVIDPSNSLELGVLVGFNPTTDPQRDNNNLSLVVLGDNEENLADGDFGYTPIPLAVEFMSFDAQHADKQVELTWITGSELNNDFFEIEHSIDGLSFNTIGKVQGNGTVSGISSYSFSHETTSSGRNFYRIKQVDYDGSYKYSEIRTINFKADLNFKVYPTMTNSTITVQFDTSVKDAKILIVSMNGSVVKSDIIDGSFALITVNMLPAETYILYVRNGSELMHKKFIKVD